MAIKIQTWKESRCICWSDECLCVRKGANLNWKSPSTADERHHGATLSLVSIYVGRYRLPMTDWNGVLHLFPLYGTLGPRLGEPIVSRWCVGVCECVGVCAPARERALAPTPTPACAYTVSCLLGAWQRGLFLSFISKNRMRPWRRSSTGAFYPKGSLDMRQASWLGSYLLHCHILIQSSLAFT